MIEDKMNENPNKRTELMENPNNDGR